MGSMCAFLKLVGSLSVHFATFAGKSTYRKYAYVQIHLPIFLLALRWSYRGRRIVLLSKMEESRLRSHDKLGRFWLLYLSAWGLHLQGFKRIKMVGRY